MKYKTILLDPPWNESGGGKCKRGADKHYDLMKSIDIYDYCLKEIHPLIDEDAHCYLWVTNNFLKDGLNLLELLGFRYVTNIVWVKDSFGLGQYFRGQHEICLFGVKGEFVSNDRTESTIINARKREHSQKPFEIYVKAEKVSSPPRLEVFSRHKRQGWDVLGNEAPKETQNLLFLG